MSHRPLADRMRPRSLEEVVGQDHLLGRDGVLRAAIERKVVPPMVLWGPPGVGKTTIALLLGEAIGAVTVRFSAVTSGVREARSVIEEARERQASGGPPTLLFVDELHRFNRAQQDAFLPHVESGTVIFVGATTENPSFQVNAPLLSRLRVVVLHPLDESAIRTILERALREPRGLGNLGLTTDPAALSALARVSDGDARRALNALELAAQLAGPGGDLDESTIARALVDRHLAHGREEHFDLISAVHKSMRGSDPQAACYWVTRMLEAGEDPLYIARRLVRFASEDVGLADPQALVIAVAARDAVHHLGRPEGDLALVEAAIYLATAPKSNTVTLAHERACLAVRESGALPVPLPIRNAPTPLMRRLGYGEGYRYDHDEADAYAPQEYLPEPLVGRTFYRPGRFGFEREIRKRLEWWARKRAERRSGRPPSGRSPSASPDHPLDSNRGRDPIQEERE